METLQKVCLVLQRELQPVSQYALQAFAYENEFFVVVLVQQLLAV